MRSLQTEETMKTIKRWPPPFKSMKKDRIFSIIILDSVFIDSSGWLIAAADFRRWLCMQKCKTLFEKNLEYVIILS
jgi:hypothetical protein